MSEPMLEPVVPEASAAPATSQLPGQAPTTPAPTQVPAQLSSAQPAGSPIAPKHAGPAAQDGSAAATPWGKAAAVAATPWAQRRGPVKPHATARLRKTIEGLPDWEPLPPGEVFVQRGRGDA